MSEEKAVYVTSCLIDYEIVVEDYDENEDEEREEVSDERICELLWKLKFNARLVYSARVGSDDMVVIPYSNSGVDVHDRDIGGGCIEIYTIRDDRLGLKGIIIDVEHYVNTHRYVDGEREVILISNKPVDKESMKVDPETFMVYYEFLVGEIASLEDIGIIYPNEYLYKIIPSKEAIDRLMHSIDIVRKLIHELS